MYNKTHISKKKHLFEKNLASLNYFFIIECIYVRDFFSFFSFPVLGYKERTEEGRGGQEPGSLQEVTNKKILITKLPPLYQTKLVQEKEDKISSDYAFK